MLDQFRGGVANDTLRIVQDVAHNNNSLLMSQVQAYIGECFQRVNLNDKTRYNFDATRISNFGITNNIANRHLSNATRRN